jgi:AraC-like DNA-binding protein
MFQDSAGLMDVNRPWRLHQGTISRAFLPPPSLRQQLLFVVERDTRGCNLNPLQAFTYFPVSPNVSICWIWQGHTERLLEWRPDDLEAPRERFNSPVLIRGGSTKPSIHYSDEPLHSLVAVFRPDAMRKLFGLEPAEWLGRIGALNENMLSPMLGDLSKKILAAQNSSAALALLYEGLENQLSTDSFTDEEPQLTGRWLAQLQGNAVGASLRSQQRLFKQLTGTTFQYLARFMRIEDLAQMVMRTYMNKQYGPGQAELAVNLGFSDQSHMAREVKRATGFTTGEAIFRLLQYESFWMFRSKLSLHL